MHVCVFHRCGKSHEDPDEAILHGLQHLADGQQRIIENQEKTMGIAQDILAAENAESAAVQALGGAIVTVVGKLSDVEGQLATLIANGTLTDDDKAALQSTLDTATATKTALNANLAAVNAALNPVPTEPESGDEPTGDETATGDGSEPTADAGDAASE